MKTIKVRRHRGGTRSSSRSKPCVGTPGRSGNGCKRTKTSKAKSRGPRKSNLTDNDSAKMKTSHGVLQGYDGVASVDARHQVVVHAQTFGEAQEHDLLQPMIAETRANFQAIGKDEDIFARACVTADSGFHTEENVKALFEHRIDAYIADHQLRKRDPRFASAERHRARAKAERQKEHGQGRYQPSDFIYDAASQTCVCPAGKQL
jgi:hypothetical protein